MLSTSISNDKYLKTIDSLRLAYLFVAVQISVMRIIKCELHSFTLSFGVFFVFPEILLTRIKLKNNSKFLEMLKYNFVRPFRLQIKGEAMKRRETNHS